MKKKRSMKPDLLTAEELDERFDAGESILEYADLDTAVFRVNVDFPAWVVADLDREAGRLGVSRQSLIKVWITERLDQLARGRKRAG